MNGKLLKGTLISKGWTIKDFAKAIGVSQTAFFRKSVGETEFTCKEIKAIMKCLNLTPDDTMQIFFN